MCNLNLIESQYHVPANIIGTEFTQSQYATQGFPGGLEGKASACNAGDPGSIPGSGRSPGGGNGNPLQYSCWKIPWTEKPHRL